MIQIPGYVMGSNLFFWKFYEFRLKSCQKLPKIAKISDFHHSLYVGST